MYQSIIDFLSDIPFVKLAAICTILVTVGTFLWPRVRATMLARQALVSSVLVGLLALAVIGVSRQVDEQATENQNLKSRLSLLSLWSQGKTMVPNRVYEAEQVGIVVATIVPRRSGLMRASVVGWIAMERQDLLTIPPGENSTADIVAADMAQYSSDRYTNIPYASITFVVVPGQFWMVHSGSDEAETVRADVRYYPLSIAAEMEK